MTAKTVPELIALIKAKPKSIPTPPRPGLAAASLGELFNLKAGTKMPVVPYRGSGPAMTDMVAGQVKIMFDTIPAVLQHVKGGSLARHRHHRHRNLALHAGDADGDLAGAGRLRGLVLVRDARTGRHAAADPRQAQRRAEQGAAEPEAEGGLALQGVVPKPSTPAEAAARIDSEIAKWGDLIKTSGIKAE